ncbi:hypothetical protein THIOSC15_2010002 [uncultured Thiomicrorhabdus sp.]
MGISLLGDAAIAADTNTTINITHNLVSGTNRVALVFVGWEGAGTGALTVSATYDCDAMTQILLKNQLDGGSNTNGVSAFMCWIPTFLQQRATKR